jgi:hypothetical protein
MPNDRRTARVVELVALFGVRPPRSATAGKTTVPPVVARADGVRVVVRAMLACALLTAARRSSSTVRV